MTASVGSLKAFERTLKSYERLYRKYLLGTAAGNAGDVRATLKKMEDLRPKLAQQYGQARIPIVETLGSPPTVATGYRDFGDAFVIVLSDPLDEPFLATALEGAIRSVQMAIGKHSADAKSPARAPRSRELTLHPAIDSAAGRLFEDGHYSSATFESSKALLRLLSTKTGIKKELTQLVEEALAIKKPRLLFSANQTAAEHDEQRGIFHLTEGVVLAVRHQGAHVAERREERDRALELLGLMSYLAFAIERATPAPPKADGSSAADPRVDFASAAAAKRSACRVEIAESVRGLLDSHLDVTRIDAVGFGDYLTIRHCAAAARRGRVETVVSFGAPAINFAEALDALRSSLQTDIAPCYGKLRLVDQTRIDEFSAALRAAATAARLMMNSPMGAVETREDRTAALVEALAARIDAVETTGDALDAVFDEAGFDAAEAARVNSVAERQRIEGHAAAVLLKNARDASYVLGVMHVQMPVPKIDDLPDLIDRLTRARDIVLGVDAEAFREATSEARAAHRRFAYEDIVDSHNTAVLLSRGEVDPEGGARMRERLARVPNDLVALEGVCNRPSSQTS